MNFRLMKGLLILLVKAYQASLSPILSKKLNCRFHPTCSNYAIMVLKKYTIKTAIQKIINRLLRCNAYNTESCIDYP